jgi:hypothetical protein
MSNTKFYQSHHRKTLTKYFCLISLLTYKFSNSIYINHMSKLNKNNSIYINLMSKLNKKHNLEK